MSAKEREIVNRVNAGINEAIADMLSKDLIPEFYAAAKSVEDSAIMPEG